MGKISKAMKIVPDATQALGKRAADVGEATGRATKKLKRTDTGGSGGRSGSGSAGSSSGAPDPKKPGAWRDNLSATDRASYDNLKGSVDRAANRSAQEFRDSMKPGELAAGKEKPYLRSMYAGTDIERAAARDSKVASDTNIRHEGASQPGKSKPDFVIGDGKNVDVTGGSDSARRDHMGRSYYEHPDQILQYPSQSPDKLKEMFDPPQ